MLLLRSLLILAGFFGCVVTESDRPLEVFEPGPVPCSALRVSRVPFSLDVSVCGSDCRD